MATVWQLRKLLSQLRQKRYMLEKHMEQMPKMLAASLIMRYRQRSSRKYESLKKLEKGTDVKSYAFLTFLESGVNRHRYVQKDKIGEVARLTEAYKVYSQKMHQIRQLNKRVVEVLDKVGDIQTEEVEKYVQKKQRSQKKNVRRINKKAARR